MNRAFILVIVLAVAVAVFATEASASRAAPGAFILEKADTVQALVDQIASNKAVSSLYVKHYGMSEDRIIKYFEQNLRLVTLKKPIKVTTYFVSRNNRILSKQRLIPAGTKVFATPSGEPVLEWRCGNPISKQLPFVETAENPKSPTTLVASNPPIEIGTLPDALVTSVETTPVLVPAASTIAPAMQAAIEPQVIASPNLSAMKVLVPALLGAVAVRSSNNNTSPEVPEPMSILTLMAGAGGVLLQYKKKNRR
ncbi:MAG: DUF6777 domain-containing protein [Armatimonadota bacterium]